MNCGLLATIGSSLSIKTPRSTVLGRHRQLPRRWSNNEVPQASSRSSSEFQESSNFLDRAYFNFTGFPFPLGPYLERKTIRYEVLKDAIWTFEQPQSLGFSSVCINIRMTVIKLKSGGLWIHAPIAPTKECLRLLAELKSPVEFIILPTYAYEHKIFVGPFSRKFPNARVHVAPRQWSWPINLPPQLFGIFPDSELKDEDTSTPWAAEIEQKIFSPPAIGIGPYVECVFFHKASKTLIVTDLVIYVPQKPLEVIPVQSLLDLARNDGLNTSISGDLTPEEVEALTTTGPLEDSPKNRSLGWARCALLVLYFRPFSLLQPEPSFNAIKEQLLVSPVVRSLVYNSIPKSCIEFIQRVEIGWKFQWIIPCHLAAPIKAKPGDLSRAFSFAYESLNQNPPGRLPILERVFQNQRKEKILKKDSQTLDGLISFLKDIGAVYNDVE